MKALRDAIFARMASQVHRDQMQFRIAGGAVNVARFLSGRPDCFAARVRSNQVKDLRSRKVLRMVVNVGARGSVSADTFFARGAAAVTLIEALERAGVRVQVDMLSLATNGTGQGGQDRLSPQGGGRGHSARQAGVLPRSPGAAPEVELRPPAEARRMDRRLHRRAPRSTRRHLHRRGGFNRDGGVARSGEGASLGAGAAEGAGDHHAGRLAAERCLIAHAPLAGRPDCTFVLRRLCRLRTPCPMLPRASCAGDVGKPSRRLLRARSW